jgi:hypothetical protein
VEGFWPIFYLMVILKIPVAALLYLVWWAARAEVRPEEETSGEDPGFRRWHRPPRRPRDPRRGGPHTPTARPLPACPPGGRFRVLTPPAPVRAAASERSADPAHERAAT